jgi:hypothetical protein
MEKPILFSTAMVQAILQGNKSMTRRVVKPQPQNMPNGAYLAKMPTPWLGYNIFYLATLSEGVITKYWQSKGYCLEGDTLWVRETWRERYGMSYAFFNGCWQPVDDIREIEYKAGGSGFFNGALNLCPCEDVKIEWGEWSKWKPSIHMPRKAARLFLTVKNIRVERLHDITEEDAMAEGVGNDEDPYWKPSCNDPDSGGSPTYKKSFEYLWDLINSKRGYGWDTNPWVWIVEFERKLEVIK